MSFISDDQPSPSKFTAEDELDAILQLDFERAFKISTYRFNDHEESDEIESHYEEQSEMMSQHNYSAYNDKITQISQDYLANADRYKSIWQVYCHNLVQRQREDAEKLEAKWRSYRESVQQRIRERAESSLSTARLLASCNAYEEAISVRDNAQRTMETLVTPEVVEVDKMFTSRYQHMIKRHYAEFQYLHKHLKQLMKALRDRAETLKVHAEADLKVDEAQTPTLIMKSVAGQNMSDRSKEKLLHNYSPRKRAPFVSSGRSSGRTTPSKFSTSSGLH